MFRKQQQLCRSVKNLLLVQNKHYIKISNQEGPNPTPNLDSDKKNWDVHPPYKQDKTGKQDVSTTKTDLPKTDVPLVE